MKRFDNFLTVACIAYLIFAVLALMIMYLWGDQWWPATLLLFGPRWLLGVPMIFLLPLACWRKPYLVVLLVLAAGIVFIPFMGFQYSFENPYKSNKKIVRVLSCNIGGENFNNEKLSILINNIKVDIVTLQESYNNIEINLSSNWNKAYNGSMTIFSRFPLETHTPIEDIHTPHTWPRQCLQPYIISTPWGKIHFNTVHLPSPRFGLQEVLHKKTLISPSESKLLISDTEHRRSVSEKVNKVIELQTLPSIIAGDFNMPVESTIYRSHWNNYKNAFTETGSGYGWTFRDSLHGVPIDIRIDHILTGNGAKPLICEVGPDVGSDHRPIIADIEIEFPRNTEPF